MEYNQETVKFVCWLETMIKEYREPEQFRVTRDEIVFVWLRWRSMTTIRMTKSEYTFFWFRNRSRVGTMAHSILLRLRHEYYPHLR